MVDTKGDWCMVGIIRADTSFSLSYPCYSIASDHQCTVLIWVMNCFFCHHKGAWGLYIKDVGFLWAVFDTPPPPCRNFDPDLPNFYLLISCNIGILDTPPPYNILTSFMDGPILGNANSGTISIDMLWSVNETTQILFETP